MQLSVADAVAVKSGISAAHEASAKADWFAPQVSDGGVLSVTVNVLLHVAVLPPWSVTVTVTVCAPRPTSVPASGDWLTVNVQLSAAVAVAAKSGTGAWQFASANAD